MASLKAAKWSIELHYNGMFVTSPFAYEGGAIKILENLNFTCMEYPEFSDFLKKETDTVCSGIYYVIPGKELHNGLRLIECDVDFKNFVDHGAKSTGKIALYLEHFGEDLTEYLEVEHEEVEQSENETVSTSDDEEDEDGGDDDDDDTASVDHLSADEVELIELRKKKKAPIIEPSGSRTIVLYDADAHEEPPKPDDMETEHESFLNELSLSLHREILVEQGSVNHKSESIFPRHNPRTYWKLMKPIVGERYESPQQLKECITNYAVANGFQIWYERNDHMRLLARCSKNAHDDETKCPWRLWATWMGNEKSFQVKSLVDEHKCTRNFKFGSVLNYKWIANKISPKVRQDPQIKLISLQAFILKKYKCQVSITQCQRAKAYAVSEYEQSARHHCDKLWEYSKEIKRTNPGSTVKMNVEVNPDGKTFFQRFYVCFHGLKEGWMHGCRRILGLGVCFLKTVHKGLLLSAVGRDGNNQIFPVAWAVVNIENKENWSWFIDLIKDDLNLGDGAGLTLISKQQTGLAEAVNNVMPQAEQRQCARHIYGKFKEKFTEEQFGKLFWEASKASYPQEFDKVMDEIRVADPDAYEYLMEKDPSTWSRVFFQTNVGCDAVENGISECFNSLIKDTRRKPVITLLESIRIIVMDRISRMKEKAEKWDDDICPAIRKKLEETKELERFWRVIPCGGSLFEVKHGADIFMVDEQTKTCSCRMWQLSGLACPHAVAAIFYINKLPETYVPDWFRISMFIKTYNHNINPLNPIKTWPKTKHTTPLAPKPTNPPKSKRPKLKKRKRNAMEACVSGGIVVFDSGGGIVNRKGRRMICKKCYEVGHNVRSCKNEKRDPPRKEAKQAGRKKMIVFGESSEGSGRKKGSQRGGKSGKRKGLFGSRPENDVLGSGECIPLAVCPPAEVPLLLRHQHEEDTGSESTSEGQREESKSMHVPLTEDENPILDKCQTPIPNQNQNPIPNQDQDQNPIPNQDQDPIPNEDQEPIPINDQEPVQNQDQDPIPVEEDQKPMVDKDQEPIPVENQEPVQNQNQDPIPIEEDQKPMVDKDQEPIPVENQEPVQNQSQYPIPIEEDQKPMVGKDQEPIQNQRQDPIPIEEDQKPMVDKDQEPIPVENQEPVQNQSQYPIPIEEDQKPMVGKDQEPIQNQSQDPIPIEEDQKSMVGKDQEPIQNQDQDPIPVEEDEKPIVDKDQDSVPNEGEDFIQNMDEDPIPNQDQDPIPVEEDQKPIMDKNQELVPNEDQDPVLTPNEDQDLIQNMDEDSILHEDEEPKSPAQQDRRSEPASREKLNEGIINCKLRKVTVEKDGEDSSMEKAVMLDE